MKNHKHIIFLTISVMALGLYIANIEPQIENPVALSGFFAVLFSSLFWGVFSLINLLKLGRVTYVISFVLSLALLYLVALSTLNSLGIVDISIVILAVTILITFIIGPLRRRKTGT